MSDPQQRLAKLTAKDLRRRRTSSGGSSLETASRRRSEDQAAEKRRTSLPGAASPQRFGWNPASPAIGKVSSLVKHGADAWGSPIGIQDDASIEVAAGRAEVLDPRNGTGGADGPQMVFSKDAVGGSDSGVGGIVGLPEADGGLMYRRDAHAESSYPDAQLYSESDSEGDGEGGSGGRLDEGASGASATRKPDQDGMAFASLAGRGDSGRDHAMPTRDDAEGAGTIPGEKFHSSWPQSLARRAVASWAGTSSSEESRADLRRKRRPNVADSQAHEGSSAATGGDDDSPTQSLRPSASGRSAEHVPSDIGDTGSTASSLGPMGSSESLMGRIGSASTSGAPVKRISWGQDQDYDLDGGNRNSSSSVRQEGEEDNAPTAEKSSSLRRGDDEAAERSRVDCEAGQPQEFRRGGVPTGGAWLNSSVESGGGAAALAASGVFDITGTSGEYEEGRGGVTIGDADSLDGETIQERTWAPQHPELEPRARQALEENAAGVVLAEDSRGLMEHLIQQVAIQYNYIWVA